MKKVAIILTVLLLLSTSVVAYAADSATIPYEDLKYVAGDVDCNEEIETIDLVTLRNVLLGTDEVVRESTADTNGDTNVDIADLVRLDEYLADGTSVRLGK